MRSWRTSPATATATAWEHPLVEWARTATSYCSIVLDCDSRESQELACAVEAGYGDLPRHNVAAQRASSGHLHLGWNLRTPVHRGTTEARRAGTPLEQDRAPWVARGVFRRTWYRHFRWAKADGESRWAKVGTEANTDRSVSWHVFLKV